MLMEPQLPRLSPPERRIILIGKTGSGKSSLGNTLLGEEWFDPDHSSRSGTVACTSATKEVRNIDLTVIDTPGLFEKGRSEEELKNEIIRSVVECSPGPHVFLIVLKVETYNELEEMVIKRIFQYFSEEVLKYSVIVFTHGDQLPEGTNIQEFVVQNENLKDVVKKCGGRCHVFDIKYWGKNDNEEEYRRNSFQLDQLFIAVERLVRNNNGGFYTNEMLQEVELMIHEAEEMINEAEGQPLLPSERRERRERARYNIWTSLVVRIRVRKTTSLLRAFCGNREDIKKICRELENIAADAERDRWRCEIL